MKKIYIIFFIILLLFSCGKKSKLNNNIINLRLNENPITLDPKGIVDVTSGEISAKLFSGLVKFDNTYKIVPDLVKNYKLNKTKTEIIFTLKENIKFSDGSFLTIEDILFSWERVLKKDSLSPRKWVLNNIKGAKKFSNNHSNTLEGFVKINKTQFKIILEKPYAPFMSLLTMPAAYIIPKHYYNNDNIDAKHKPLGAGPYILKKWIQDHKIHLIPNPNYYEDIKRPEIIYKIIPEDASSVAMLLTNELDIIKIPRQQVEYLKKQLNHFTFIETEELNTYYIGFNHRNNYLDINFKNAVLNAIDKKNIINNVLKNQAKLALSPIPNSLCYNIKIPSNETLSQKKAIEFYKKSKAFNKKILFLIPSNKETSNIALIILDSLKKVGVKIQLKTLDWSAYKEALNKGEADIFFMSWWADYADAENFLVPTFHSKNIGASGNRVYYSNKNLDLLLDSFQTQFDIESKRTSLTKIIKILNTDLPWIPLWHRISSYAINPKLINYKPYAMYSLDKGLNLQTKKE